jgi:hypothetical protein
MIDFTQHTFRAAAVLTGSYVAGTVFEGGDAYNTLDLLVSFTKSGATSMEWKIEYSHDGTTYFQETTEATTAPTATTRELEHTIVAANQAVAAQGYHYRLACSARYIKVSAKVTGTATTTSATVIGMFSAN